MARNKKSSRTSQTDLSDIVKKLDEIVKGIEKIAKTTTSAANNNTTTPSKTPKEKDVTIGDNYSGLLSVIDIMGGNPTQNINNKIKSWAQDVLKQKINNKTNLNAKTSSVNEPPPIPKAVSSGGAVEEGAVVKGVSAGSGGAGGAAGAGASGAGAAGAGAAGAAAVAVLAFMAAIETATHVVDEYRKYQEISTKQMLGQISEREANQQRITQTLGYIPLVGGLFQSIAQTAYDLENRLYSLADAVRSAALSYGQSFQNAANTLIDLGYQEQVNGIKQEEALVKYQGEVNIKQIETQGRIANEQLRISLQGYVAAVKAGTGPLIDGINKAAYDAARSQIDISANQQKLSALSTQLHTNLENFKSVQHTQYEQQKSTLSADLSAIQASSYETMLNNTISAGTQAIEIERLRNVALPDAQRQSNFWSSDVRNTTNGLLLSPLLGFYGPLAGYMYGRSRQEDTRQAVDNLNANLQGTQNILRQNFQDSRGNTRDGQYIWRDVESHYGNQIDWGIGTFSSMSNLTPEQRAQMIQAMNFPMTFNASTQAANARGAATLQSASASLENTKAGLAQRKADALAQIQKEAADITIEAQKAVKERMLELAENVEKYLEKFDDATNDLGINLGMTGKDGLHSYQKSMFNIVEKVAAKFGKEIEDVVKLQETYIEETGRNRQMGEHDYGQLFALGKYLGDDSIAAKYASGMEIFNQGVDASVDQLDKVLQSVNKIGLNGRKYTKQLVDNLKLAEKYQFKGGTSNLMKMAKWAENTRFNMNSLDGMLQKISEGGLEGAITMGAQFQVLGGHAAMNADPIAMIYERYADPEAYAKRIQDMTKGYGRLDRKTGETFFGGEELMLIEQIAKISGRSSEEVQNEIRARNKKSVIAHHVNGNFDDDQLSLISNLATYNKATGSFQVKLKDGSDKDVSQLTAQDLTNLMPEAHEERMEEYMLRVLSALEGVRGEELQQKANLAAATYEEFLNQYAERIKIAEENYIQNRERFIEETKAGMQSATSALQSFIHIWTNGNTASNQVQQAVNDLVTALPNLTSAVNNAATEIRNSTSGGNNGGSTTTNVRDGVITSNGSSMFAAAKSVTPIRDGAVELAKTDARDVGVFAKTGGPFDTLFNNVFSRIDDVYKTVVSDSPNYYGGYSHGSLDDINVNINGNLTLQGENGNSVNLSSELQNNPLLIRTIVQLIVQHMSKTVNGGRGVSRMFGEYA